MATKVTPGVAAMASEDEAMMGEAEGCFMSPKLVKAAIASLARQVGFYSGGRVYDGPPMLDWTELDVSEIVGEGDRALCFFRANTAVAIKLSFRAFGDEEVAAPESSNIVFQGEPLYQGGRVIAYYVALTDEAGKLEWLANVAPPGDMQLNLDAFVPLKEVS